MERPPYLLGGFSEYGYVLPESGRIRVPDNVPNELASLSSCAFRSVMNAFDNLGGIIARRDRGHPGRRAARPARDGARRDRRARAASSSIGAPDDRLALASRFGATETISIETHDAAARLAAVREATDGRGADVVMEFTGHPAAFGEGLDIVRKGGRYLIVGQLGEGATEIKPSTIVKKNVRVIGSFSGDARSYWKALDLRLAAHRRHSLRRHDLQPLSPRPGERGARPA